MGLPPELQAALLDRRVIFLRGRLDDASVGNVIAQLLLAGQTPSDTIRLYIDSPGGSIAAALALYDMLRSLGAPVSTTSLGSVGGAAVLVLAGGSPGARFALPHARIHLSDAEFETPTAAGADFAGQAAEFARQRDRWLDCLARHAIHSAEFIGRDLATGRWLSAAEARDYGLVDGIIPGVAG